MKEKTLIRIGFATSVFFILFIIFEVFTFGRGIFILDYKRWMPVYNSKPNVVGSFKPDITIGRNMEYTTIIPLVLTKQTVRPTNRICVIKEDTTIFSGYDRFEYVRFTKFEVHYESGHVQILLKEDSPIREKKFKVSNVIDYILFCFELERIETCRVVVEGYSKFLIGSDEEFFRFARDWYIDKSIRIRSGRRLGE